MLWDNDLTLKLNLIFYFGINVYPKFCFDFFCSFLDENQKPLGLYSDEVQSKTRHNQKASFLFPKTSKLGILFPYKNSEQTYYVEETNFRPTEIVRAFLTIFFKFFFLIIDPQRRKKQYIINTIEKIRFPNTKSLPKL